MGRKLIYSLFFLVFMAILATCSMSKEELPPSAEAGPSSLAVAVALVMPE